MIERKTPLPKLPAPSSLEAAQELMAEAWQTSPMRAEELAREALEISEDCVDAYLLLGQLEDDPQEALEWHRRAVDAATRALGPDAFTEMAGGFWGFLETRPYMRAVESLALCLLSLGRDKEAMDRLRDMLRLNPWDNQGARHALLPLLIVHDLDQEAETLFERYGEAPFANWAYARVLLDLRRDGTAGASARESLELALERNPYVPLYLLGERELPTTMPGPSDIGSPEEAMWYVVNDGPAWKASPGAMEWLADAWAAMREEYPLPPEESWADDAGTVPMND